MWFHCIPSPLNQLNEAERAAVDAGTDTVGRNLGAILEERQTPGEKDHQDEGPALGNLHLLKLQMPVPGECHENIGHNEQ